MSDIVDTVEMPDQDGKSPGDFWYGLPINPTLATHVWNGREWRPLLTEEGYYKAEITALRAEMEKLRRAEEKCLVAVDHVGRMNSRERIQEAKLMVRCAFSGQSSPQELEA